MVAMEVPVHWRVLGEQVVQLVQRVPVLSVELSMAEVLPDITLEQSRTHTRSARFRSQELRAVLVEMEATAEQEVMGDHRELVEWEVRRVRLQQEVLVACFMLEDLSDTTLLLESFPVRGPRVRLRPPEARAVTEVCEDFQELEELVVPVLVALAVLVSPVVPVVPVVPVMLVA
jgi:hypothetical protein